MGWGGPGRGGGWWVGAEGWPWGLAPSAKVVW